MAKTVIGIPVPMDFKIDVRTAAYCAAEATRPGVTWGYVASRDAGVGRSTFAWNALKDPDVTHLYFMDYDVVPPNGTLQRLLEYDLPIVAGIYPMLTNELSWSFKLGNGWVSAKQSFRDELTKVTAVGGSTLLVKREVLENIKPPCFKIQYREIDESGKCYDEGEDEYFSRVAIEAGYDLYVDPTIKCEHYNYVRL